MGVWIAIVMMILAVIVIVKGIIKGIISLLSFLFLIGIFAIPICLIYKIFKD